MNLSFVLDRSGSMSGGKLELAKRAVEEALARLDARDRFSIVVYDDVIDLVVESTPASAEARRNAIARLATIDARGSTNLSDGWLRGCEQVAAHLAADGVDRCLLLTDGLANVGVTDADELAHHAAELRARGVSTTTFGVGNDFDERLLQAMADAGGGHFYYIADAAQIRDHIASEVGETLEVVARDVELELVAGEGVQVEAISPHPVQPRGSRSVIGLGDLVADQALEVVLRLTFPYGQVGRETGVIVAVRDRDGAFAARARTRLASPGPTRTTPPTTPSRETPTSIGPSRVSSPHVLGRRRCFAIARATTNAPDGLLGATAEAHSRLRRARSGAASHGQRARGRATGLRGPDAGAEPASRCTSRARTWFRSRDAQGRSVKRG